MSKKKSRFISLNLKMTAAIIVGIILALVMYGLCTWFTNYITNVRYLSVQAVERNVGEAYDSLEAYIEKNKLSATETKSLSKWMQDQDYTYFFVYDNFTNIFEAGWWVSSETNTPVQELEDEDSTIYGNINRDDERRIDEDSFESDVKNRIVQFADGKYYVFIDVYKEQRWIEIMKIVTIVLCFLTFLLTVLVYNGRVLKRIIKFSTEVQKISDGSLEYAIKSGRNDEIGNLALSVDNMRTSIIKKHQNEKDAWEANTQLITAMSHDIRTPLTSMIGYLDIIESKKYKSQEELEKYVSSCRDKAFQLKDLSDKLFQYFLVFGNKENDKTLEEYDASILFQQLLAEHSAEIISYGYKVGLVYSVPEVNVMMDISASKRLFDNMFSNIMKYADKRHSVEISAYTEEKKIIIKVRNHILENAKKVESTKIGLRTCKKICADMHGEFQYTENENVFETRAIFPIAKEKKETEEKDTVKVEKGE